MAPAMGCELLPPPEIRHQTPLAPMGRHRSPGSTGPPYTRLSPFMKCIATTKSGKPCPNNAGHKYDPDSRYCYMHDPALEAQRAKDRMLGRATQQAKRKRAPVKKPDDMDQFVLEMLQEVIDRLNSHKGIEADKALTTAINALDRALDRRHSMLGKGDVTINVEPSQWETDILERQFEIWADERGYVKPSDLDVS